MVTVTILALDNVLASSVMGPLDILSQTGVTWNHIAGADTVSYFDVKIVTKDGQFSKSRNCAAIQPNCSMWDVDSTDLVLISSFSDTGTLETSVEAVEWLRHHYKRGATLASICAGTYILAETGLLDGKTATTHWGLTDDFRKRYPAVRVMPEKIIVDEGRVLSSGGCNSYIDLSVYLVEKYCGKRVALESSKAMLHDPGRDSQVPYAVYQFAGDHTDLKIKKIQQWLVDNYPQSIDFRNVSELFGMSRRVFERRFKTATGITPLVYLQQLRVEKAKNMLENSCEPFSEIALRVGYEDTSFFRKVFKKHTHLLPKEYRAKFCREYPIDTMNIRI